MPVGKDPDLNGPNWQNLDHIWPLHKEENLQQGLMPKPKYQVIYKLCHLRVRPQAWTKLTLLA